MTTFGEKYLEALRITRDLYNSGTDEQKTAMRRQWLNDRSTGGPEASSCSRFLGYTGELLDSRFPHSDSSTAMAAKFGEHYVKSEKSSWPAQGLWQKLLSAKGDIILFDYIKNSYDTGKDNPSKAASWQAHSAADNGLGNFIEADGAKRGVVGNSYLTQHLREPIGRIKVSEWAESKGIDPERIDVHAKLYKAYKPVFGEALTLEDGEIKLDTSRIKDKGKKKKHGDLTGIEATLNIAAPVALSDASQPETGLPLTLAKSKTTAESRSAG